jgi:hypothetical protein
MYVERLLVLIFLVATTNHRSTRYRRSPHHHYVRTVTLFQKVDFGRSQEEQVIVQTINAYIKLIFIVEESLLVLV